MIKVDKGEVTIVGQHPLVLAELTTLVHTLYHHIFTEQGGISPEKAKEQINHAVELGFMTKEQTNEKACEMILQSLTGVLDALMAGINKKHGKDDE